MSIPAGTPPKSHATIVSKFGGSSMKDATCILRSAQTALKRSATVVVVSATYGTTNTLEKIAAHAQAGQLQDMMGELEAIKTRHLEIASDLNMDEDLLEHFKKILNECENTCQGMYLLSDVSGRSMDTLYSIGERLSSTLMAQALRSLCTESNSLQVNLLDAREIIITDNVYGKAAPLLNEIYDKAQNLIPLVKDGHKQIYSTEGFIGRSTKGHNTTLGRGGSDYSAALFAYGLNADLLEIWTDVAGISTTDPRICPQAESLREITFQEAGELATFGAKILHPTTIMPAEQKNIPVYVGSSFEPEIPGTLITAKVQNKPLIRAMALKEKQVLITIRTPKMLNTHGFLFEVFRIFNEHKVSVDSITTSEISLALTVDEKILQHEELFSDLTRLAHVEIQSDLALVSLIGNHINHTPNLAYKVFETLCDINVRMICQGASRHNFCFLVHQKDAKEAIGRLHQELIEQKAFDVFGQKLMRQTPEHWQSGASL